MNCECGRELFSRSYKFGLCPDCRKDKFVVMDKMRRKESSRKYYSRLRLNVIARYGGRCACCEEDRVEFLALDHIDGTGSEHRKTVASGYPMYRWVINNEYPSNIRLMCHNCNMSMGAYGYCPHQVPSGVVASV